MSKKIETEQTQQPDFVKELLENGTTTITAKTREELIEMVNTIPADCSYGAGAVGQDRDNGLFVLRLDITPNQ